MAFIIVAHSANRSRGLSLQTATETLAALTELELAGFTIQRLSDFSRTELDRDGLAHLANQEPLSRHPPIRALFAP